MTEQSIKEIIADVLQISIDEISLDKSFEKDLGADSLDRVEIVMNIEDKFNIQVPDSSLEEIITVGDAVKAVESIVG